MLSELVKFLMEHGAGAAGLALGGAIVHVATVIRNKYIVLRDKKRKGKLIPRLIDADISVYKYLAECLIETEGDRAFVVLFHNGVYYLNSTSQMKMSCTHEIVRDGISREQSSMQDLLISRFPTTISDIINNKSVSFYPHVDSTKYFCQILKQQGVGKVVISAMKCDNIVEGFVGVSYLEDNSHLKSEAVVMSHIHEASMKIGVILRKNK